MRPPVRLLSRRLSRLTSPAQPTRSGARTDQDADRGTGEPGHQREGDPEKAELGLIAVTTLGIQTVADAAYPAVAMLVIIPVGRSTRARTSPQQEEPRGEPPQP